MEHEPKELQNGQAAAVAPRPTQYDKSYVPKALAPEGVAEHVFLLTAVMPGQHSSYIQYTTCIEEYLPKVVLRSARYLGDSVILSNDFGETEVTCSELANIIQVVL